MTGVSLFSGRQPQSGRARGSQQSLGSRGLCRDRTAERLSAGLTDRLDFWTFGGDGVRWLGVVLFAAGGAVRLWPVFVLGRRFSGLVAIQPGHTLVTTGIYSIIRHPSYLGLLVSSLGWGLAFRSGVGVCWLCSPWSPSSGASARRRRCCALSSAPSTMPTAVARRG